MNYEEYRHALIWAGAIEDEPKLSPSEAKGILKGNHAWMLRNIFDFDCGEETNYWYILKDIHSATDYDRKTRYYVKKAHETFDIVPITLQTMRNQAYRVYRSAHEHYKVNDGFVMGESAFKKEIDSLPDTTECWGCINRESSQLDAYAVCSIRDGNCWIKYVRAVRGDGQKYSPLYGLYDTLLDNYLNVHGLKFVTNNARSITEHSAIESFLLSKFGFRKAHCKVKLYYKPWLRFVINTLYPMRRLIPIAQVKNLLKFEELSRGNSNGSQVDIR